MNHVLGILENEREILIRVSRTAEPVDFAFLDDAPVPLHSATEAWLADRE